MSKPIQPGWYKSKLPFLRNAVRVHIVSEGRVIFSRRGIPNISICTEKHFHGIAEEFPKTGRKHA